jgi:hypothetical protein
MAAIGTDRLVGRSGGGGASQCCTGRPRRPTAYTRSLLAMLDGLRFVQRYAWLMNNCWSDTACRYGSQFNGVGKLTTAGATFAGRAVAGPSDDVSG